MTPHVWRFVGFGSAVVGLFCYALSSAFNHLFGEWNWLKIFLYSVISFIICVPVIFAEVWQHSNSLRFKAHMAFLVLTITSVYSFFFDKAVNGKPSAYSLISCSAFAMMSLSLSRQTHCGFEVDLLYFFLGALIVQVMKIKLWLGIAGVGFSYSLIFLRSSLHATPENRYAELQDQNYMVIQVDSQPSIFDSAVQMDSPQANIGKDLLITPEDPTMTSFYLPSEKWSLETLLELDDLQQANNSVVNIDDLQQANNSVVNIDSLQLANQAIVEVLWSCLNEYLTDKDDRIPVALMNERSFFLMDQFPWRALQKNVNRMVVSGFQKKCSNEYISWRREFLRMCLMRFGLKELSTEEFDQKEKIKRWIKLSNIALRILLPNEKILYDRIFGVFSSVDDLSFMQLCKEVTTILLNFANDFANGSCSLNLLPTIVQVFGTLHELIPEFQSLLSDQYSVSTEAIMITQRLGEAIRDIFMQLEDLILSGTTRATIPGGICPITIEVMNHLSVVAEGKSSSLSKEVTKIIGLLECNLEVKSKHYPNLALGFVFLMNNQRYIEQKAKQYQLGTILGDYWIQQQTAKIRENLEHYQRSSWDEVLGLLKLDSNELIESNVAAESMKKKLNLFNLHFKELRRDQNAWFVNDEELKQEILESLEKILFPAYGMFVTRFDSVLGKHADEYTRYSIFDMQDLLTELFEGWDE